MKTDMQYLLEDLEIKEPLEEMATVFRDIKRNMICQVNPDSGRIGLEYFKIYNHINVSAARKIARIEFRRPEYVIHSDNKQKWFLNSSEKKILMFVLQTESKKYKGYTNFQAAIIDFNNEKGLDIDLTEQNFVNDLKYPDYLPIDLPMPNYLDLK